jgi:hypothetical protein
MSRDQPRNLKYMRAFAAAWSEQQFVQEALARIPWYHQIALLEKVSGPAAIAKGKAMSRTIEFSSRLAPARFRGNARLSGLADPMLSIYPVPFGGLPAEGLLGAARLAPSDRVGGELAPAALPHHRTCGSAYGGS